MAVLVSRAGWSGLAEFLLTTSQSYAAATVLDGEGEFVAEGFRSQPSSADLYAETGGGIDTPFPETFAYVVDVAEVVMQAELEGNEHGSLVFPYGLDAGEGKPARLLSQFIDGRPDDDEVIFRFLAADSAYRINQAQCRGYADVPATADTVLLLKKNGTTVGTATFLTGQVLAEIIITNTTVALGDRLRFHAASPQDATLADFVVVFALMFVG